MAWITLTEADALTVVNAKLLTAARTKVIAEGQPDPLFDTLLQVIDDVRGSVGACSANSLGPAGTIPQKLKATALDFFAVRLLSRLDIEPEKGKVMLFEVAERRLKSVAACAFDIEEPVVKTEEKSSSGGRPLITPRCHRYSRDDGDGA